MPEEPLSGASVMEEFIDRRVADAHEELVRRDPEYAAYMGKVVRAIGSGLAIPEQVIREKRPKQRLSKRWHELLEACFELPWHYWHVEYASRLASGDFVESSAKETVIRSEFYRASTFIHLQTLCEHVEKVIKHTARVYLSPSQASETSKRFQQRMRKEHRAIAKLRQQCVHPLDPPASGVTEAGLWESAVVMGHNGFRVTDPDLQELAGYIRSGMWRTMRGMTEVECRRLGQVLLDLEGELP